MITSRPTGSDRTDDPILSLADDQRLRRAVHDSVRELCRRGPSSAISWMLHPQPGDLVVETTGRDFDHRSVGYLLETRAEQGGDVSYVQYGPAPEDVCRHTNSEFMRAPRPQYCRPVAEETYTITTDRDVTVAAFDLDPLVVFTRTSSTIDGGTCTVAVATMGDYNDDLGNSYTVSNGTIAATFTPEEFFSGQDGDPDVFKHLE